MKSDEDIPTLEFLHKPDNDYIKELLEDLDDVIMDYFLEDADED